MSILTRAKKYKVFNKTLAPKAALGLVVMLATMIVLSVALIGAYINEISQIGIGDIPEAKNVGNWDYVDKYYVLKKYEILNIDGRNVGAVTLRDNQSGNKLVVFESEFTLSEIPRTKEEILNKFLVAYGLDNSYFRDSGITGRYGQEVAYQLVGWKSITGEETGIIGNIDCSLGNGNKSSIFLIVVNTLDKFNGGRALEFANILKCPEVITDNTGDDVVDKLDTDKDGLIDKVEKMLKNTDPYKADTDGDGTNDGDEIKIGRNPAIHRQWQDVFTPQEFEKVKADIKFISIYNYDKLFPQY